MAKRLYGDVYGINDTKYTIEIYDRQVSATAHECSFFGGGITYKGQGNKIYENILMSSSLSINIKVDSQAKLDIMWDIVEKGENYYYAVIKKSDNLKWIGTVVSDQMTLPRGDYQGVIETQVMANDRLTILNSLPFDFGTYSLSESRERGLELIKQILQYDCSHFLDHWGASDNYILESIESTEASQADGALYNTSYKKESFIKNYDPEVYVSGEEDYISCADAIKQILSSYKAQILMDDGAYVIRQAENNFTSSTEFFKYSKTLTKLTGLKTISNGLNADNSPDRSCFQTFPDYTFQAPIREISADITKLNAVSSVKTVFDDTNMTVVRNTNVPTNKTFKLAFKTGDLTSAYSVGGVTHVAFETHFAALIYGYDGTDYWYYQNDQWNNNGTTVPDSTKSFIFLTVSRYNNTPEEYSGTFEFPSHSLNNMTINVWGRDHLYAPLVSRPSYDPKLRQFYWKFSQIGFADFTGVLSVTESYNDADDDESPLFEDSQRYTNDILAANDKFTNNPEYDGYYHSGEIYDIFGLLTYDGSAWTANPSIKQVGFTDTHKFEVLPLVMAANIYEKTVYVINGDLHTNGAIHPINSIGLDNDTWVFNGGTLNFKNETISGEWIRVAKNTVKSGGGGGVKYGTGTGLGDQYKEKIRHLGRGLSNVRSQFGDLLGFFIAKVYEENGDTANPGEDTTKSLKLVYDHSTQSHNLKFGTEGPEPFNVTSDVSLVSFGATGVVITLTGSYFKDNSVVKISKGTLNSVTISNQGQMVLNIDAIASSDPTGNTCDVTIDGVVFTALWTYAVNYTGTLADDYITARGITDEDHESYLQTLETALFTAGLINDDGTSNGKLDALWLFGGTQATATGHKWNFIDAQNTDEAFRLTMYGGLTHNSNGITGNGTDGYIDTHFAASDFGGQDDAHVGIYIRNDLNPGAALKGAYGARHSSFNGTVFFPRYNSTLYSALNSATGSGTANTNTTGHWVTSRTSSTVSKLYRNGSEFWDSGLTSSASQPAASIKLLAVDFNEGQFIYQHSAYNIAGAHMGGKLTATEISDLYDALDAYYTSLGINV